MGLDACAPPPSGAAQLGQTSSSGLSCGIYAKPYGPLFGAADYLDRFGNKYSEAELTLGIGIGADPRHPLSEIAAQNCDATGVFNPIYTGEWAAEEQATICQVLQDVSDIIAPGGPPGIINIQISKEALSAGTLGSASPKFSKRDCGIAQTTLMTALNGGGGSYPGGFVHGFVRISSAFDWHVIADDDPQDPNHGVAPGAADLYSVALHELMHVVGFASLITDDGSSWGDGIYSYWDRHLYSGVAEAYLIAPDAGPDCCDAHAFDLASIGAMPAALQGACQDMVSFWDGSSAIAIVADAENAAPQGAAQMANRLSHLEIDCASAAEYVMDANFELGAARRELTAAELEILCRLGQGTGAGCAPQDNCLTLANDDFGFVFFLSEGSNGAIPLSEILVNDAAPAGFSVDVKPGCGFNPGLSVVYDPADESFKLSFSATGQYSFCYELEGCDGNCDEATVNIFILDEPIPVFCAPSPSCNLVCFGDFESFAPGGSNYFPQLDIEAFLFCFQNTPDVGLDEFPGGSNQMLRMAVIHDGCNIEAASIPLASPVAPGCTLQVNFKAVYESYSIEQGTPTLKFFALEELPCGNIQYPLGCDGSSFSVACPSGNTGFCMTAQSFPGQGEGIVIQEHYAFPDSPTPALGQYTFTWVNDTGVDIYALLIAPGNSHPDFAGMSCGCDGNTSLYLDDLEVFSSCQSALSIEVDQPDFACLGEAFEASIEVCLSGESGPAQVVNLQLGALPPGFSIVGGDFDSNGLASFSLAPGDCRTLLLQLDVPDSYLPGTFLSMPLSVFGEFSYCISTSGADANIDLYLQDCEGLLPCCPTPSAAQLSNTSISAAIAGSLLPPGGTSGTVCVDGVLAIDESYVFSGTLYFGPDAQIVIEQGATLELDGARLSSGCDFLWKGISAHHFNPGGSPSLISHNGTHVEDAKIAVDASNKAVLHIERTSFDRNAIGLNLAGVNLSGFYSNTFDCSSPLKPSLGPAPEIGDVAFAGIVSQGGTLHVGVAGAGANIFQRLRNGIINRRGHLMVENSVFRDIEKDGTEPYPFTGFGIRHAGLGIYSLVQRGLGDGPADEPSFDRCYVAIWADQARAAARFNRIEDAYIGIQAQRCAGMSIHIDHNRISCDYVGIYLLQNAPAAYIAVWANHITVDEGAAAGDAGTGIFVNDQGASQQHAVIEQNQIFLHRNNVGVFLRAAKGYTVRSNAIRLEGASEPGARGIALENAENCRLSCNYAEGLGLGAGYLSEYASSTLLSCNEAAGLADGLIVGGPSAGTFLETNTFKPPLQRGLLYRENIAMMPPQVHAGNRWESGAYGDAAAVHLGSGDFSYFFEQRFEVHTTSPPYYPPSISLPNSSADPTDWFFFDPSGSPGTCNPLTSCPLIGFAPEEDEAKGRETQLAQGGYAGEWPGGLHWAAQQQLYAMLERSPGIRDTSALMDGFYQAMQAGPLGQLRAAAQGVESLYGLLPAQAAALQQHAQHADSLLALLALADSLRAQDPALPLPALPQELLAQCDSLAGLAEALGAPLASLRRHGIQFLSALNASALDTAAYQSNEKTVNGLYLAVLLGGAAAIDSAQAAALYAIAQQCPDEGGPAVYRARSLYAWHGAADFNGSYCQPAAARQSLPPQAAEPAPREKDASFRAFPNPNRGSFTLEYELEAAGRLLLTDLMGRSLAPIALPAGRQRLEAAPEGLKAGVYLLRVVSEAGVLLHAEKIIIIR